MKIGDYVGWAGTWDDDTGLQEVGIVVDVLARDDDHVQETWCEVWNGRTGKIIGVQFMELEVIFEARQ